MPTTIEWSDDEMQLLINLRRERNEDYWRRFRRSSLPFWNEIAATIQERFTTAFNGLQAREKFKGMVRDCKVSKIFVNERIIIFILIVFTIILIFQLFEKYADGDENGRWTYVEEVFGEQFKTPFWKRPGWNNKTFQLIFN